MAPDGSPGARAASVHRFFRQALERRVVALNGPARQLGEDRLSALKDAAEPKIAASDMATPSQGTLRELLDHLARQSASLDKGAPQDERAPLAALDHARQLWSRLRTEGQAREALAAEPAGAGPLNSARLVHRSLHLMREASPAYLQHFLAYADALSWLEAFDAATPKPKPASKPKTSRKTR